MVSRADVAQQNVETIPIGKRDMVDLFDYIEDGLMIVECDHSFRYTEAFLASRSIGAKAALEWIRRQGARCDCEILDGIEPHWGDG